LCIKFFRKNINLINYNRRKYKAEFNFSKKKLAINMPIIL
jgi:hypothetical protein